MNQLKSLLRARPIKNIVILTGAGISAESGIQTFRDGNGLWNNHRIEDVATPQAFQKKPDLVYDFYNQRRQQLFSNEVSCNPAHFALADFENSYEGEFTLISQNVDNLHQRAGSKKLISMHGQLDQMRCRSSQKIFTAPLSFSADNHCECCAQKGNLRPHIVWFGEMPLHMERIFQSLSDVDLFICIGTSGHVYPAAGFVELANQVNAITVECNLDQTLLSSQFEFQFIGKAGEVVPELMTLLTDVLVENS